jgi:succinate dehydrogenase / fumarate reductase iron-sulfur subunit
MRLRIQRWEPSREAKPRYQVYEVERLPGQTVLGALFTIREDQDGSLAFRYSCRGAVCGSCAMLINKVPRLACKTQLKDIVGEVSSNLRPFGPLEAGVEDWDTGTEVLVEPLPNFPVLRDLVVDMTRFWEAYEAVEPWLVPEGEPPEGVPRPMDPEQVSSLERLVNCILCALCNGSCPIVGQDQDFLGPAPLAKAWRFCEDPRDIRRDGIIEMLDTEEGIMGCELIYNCVKVCPRNVAPGGAIRQMKEKARTISGMDTEEI